MSWFIPQTAATPGTRSGRSWQPGRRDPGLHTSGRKQTFPLSPAAFQGASVGGWTGCGTARTQTWLCKRQLNPLHNKNSCMEVSFNYFSIDLLKCLIYRKQGKKKSIGGRREAKMRKMSFDLTQQKRKYPYFTVTSARTLILKMSQN